MKAVPKTPEKVQGLPLEEKAALYLSRLIEEIYRFDTLRPAQSIVEQAVGIFEQKIVPIDGLMHIRVQVWDSTIF